MLRQRIKRLLAFIISVKFMVLAQVTALLITGYIDAMTWQIVTMYILAIRFGQRFKTDKFSFEDEKKDG